MAKVRLSKTTNVIVQVVFSFVLMGTVIIMSLAFLSDNREATEKQDEIPLFRSDYYGSESEVTDISIHQNKNPLGSSTAYFVFSVGESIHYEIYQSKMDWILDKIWEEEMMKKSNQDRDDCTMKWEAQEAYRNKIGNYYVRYKDQIFMLSEDSDLELSMDQIAVIREKMNLR